MAEPRTTILIDQSKKNVVTTSSGLKSVYRRLKNTWKVSSIKDEITADKLKGVLLFMIAAPKQKFTEGECKAIKTFMEDGGNVMLLLGEGGEAKLDTNVNFLMEDHGIIANSDAVIRSAYQKDFFHPKECLVTNGVLNREITAACGKRQVEDSPSSGLRFVYAFGATLKVTKPATALLSTGSVSLPMNQPVCALANIKRKGRLMVLGSYQMFSDQYFDKEDNAKLFDVLLQLATSSTIQLNAIDAQNPDVPDNVYLPDTAKLAEQLRVCLQEGDEVPRDFTTLADRTLFGISTAAIPAAVRAFEELRVTHEPLALITPQFETPLPPLMPAVFPPTFRELDGPALDLYDLDECFSSEKIRLAQLTNKCNDDDLEYFVRECGEIFGIKAAAGQQAPLTGKQVLEQVLRELAEFKKINHDK
eukprot:m.230426 g.230426  ORF g.230426 m.230426 type:complete len:418 (-) comp18009_c0_seq1:218-1471(-)